MFASATVTTPGKFTVKFEIHRTSILTGGNTILYSFKQHGVGAGSAFTTVQRGTGHLTLISANFIYWIEARSTVTISALFADPWRSRSTKVRDRIPARVCFYTEWAPVFFKSAGAPFLVCLLVWVFLKLFALK